jgi:hypothetical protein
MAATTPSDPIQESLPTADQPSDFDSISECEEAAGSLRGLSGSAVEPTSLIGTLIPLVMKMINRGRLTAGQAHDYDTVRQHDQMMTRLC